jgi:hypothetical protein
MAPSGDSSNTDVGATPVDVGAGEVIPVVGAKVLAVPPVAKENVIVPQDGDNSGSNNDEGSSSSDDEGSGRDDQDTTLHIPSRETPSDIIWFKCLVCLGAVYNSLVKVILHAFDFINKNTGASDVVEQHRQVLWANGRSS